MANIDEKSLSALLEKIGTIRSELDTLENELKGILASPFAEPVGEPAVEPVAEPVEEPAMDIVDDIPQEPIDISIADIDLPSDKPSDLPSDMPDEIPSGQSHSAILDSKKAENAVMDVMAARKAWRIDRPGSTVKNVISAISLNDRVLLINVLFNEDALLFQDTISKFNQMGSLDEALEYISANFPDWDMNSEPVYRLMMAVRRKFS